MSGLRDAPCTHDEAQQMLPWGVTGRLPASEVGRFEAHVAACPDCQADFEVEHRIRGAMRQSPRVEYAPQASFQKLWSRVEAVAADAPTRPSGDSTSIDALRAGPTPATWRVAAAAVLGLAVGFIAATLWRAQPVDAPAEYTTASQPDIAVASSAQIRVVFSPATTVDELTRVMRETRLIIVDGPSESGVYGLTSSSGDLAAARSALAQLRADPRVRFAEPVSAQSTPTP